MVSKEEYKAFISKLVEKDKENKNIKCLKKGYTGWAIFGIVFSPMVFCAAFPVIFTVSVFLGCLLAFFGIVGIVFSIIRFVRRSKAVSYYMDTYRDKIIDYLLKGHNYYFNADSFIKEEIFEKSQFEGYYERYTGEDLLVINIPNDDGSESSVNLNLCDLDVTKTEEDDDGDTHTVTVYSGVFGYVEFPFDFKCVLGINSSYYIKGLKMEKVKLEDIKFNKVFKIYSNDQIEARYILTPDMMEKLMILACNFVGLRLNLVDNKMYIGSVVNLFELNLSKRNGIESLFDNFYDDVKTILEIVNEIKNNNKIFKM